MEEHDAHTTPIYSRALILPKILHAPEPCQRIVHQEAQIALACQQARSNQHPMPNIEKCLGSHMSPSSGPRLTPD